MSTCAICHAQKQVVLDLNGGITWQEVFDAGFRPKHLSSGDYMCTEYGASVTIKNSRTGSQVNMGVGDVDFKLKADHLLVQMSFYGRESRSLEDAKAKSESFAKMFGENVTQIAKLTTFQTKHEVDYDGRKIDPPEIEEHVDLKTTINAAKVEDFSIIYSFSDSYSNDLPLVERLSVALKSQEVKRAKRLTEKIRPPAGYEYISLELNQDDDALENESTLTDPKSEQDSSKVPKSADKLEIGKEETATESSTFLPWIIAGLLLLGILAILFKVWKGKSER
jgi:hypothetical protein